MMLVISTLIFALFVSTSNLAAATHDVCNNGDADNHVETVQCQHQMAIKKGEVAARVWKVEQDIKVTKDLCIMVRPEIKPATTERQPVKGDWVRPKRAPTDHARVCLPLRWKKFEDDDKCGWEMKAEDKAQVLVTDAAGKFRLSNPTTGKQSAMTAWENWTYDDTVFDGIKEDVINLKIDCEKVVFSLYSSQTDIKNVAEQLQELHGKEVQGQLRALQEKLKVADERLEKVHVLKSRYDQVCR